MTNLRSVSEIFSEAIRSIHADTVKHLQDQNRKSVLGRNLDGMVGSGTGKTLVALAYYSDALRLVHDAVLADGRVSESEIDESHELLREIANVFAKVRAEYRYAADLERDQTPRFLQLFRQDAGPFGYQCRRTRWAGFQIARNLQNNAGDSKPLERLRETYVKAARQLAKAGEMSIEEESELSALIQGLLWQDGETPFDRTQQVDATRMQDSISWADVVATHGRPRECSLLPEPAWKEAVACDCVMTILHAADGSQYIGESGLVDGNVFTRVVFDKPLNGSLRVVDVDIAEVDADFHSATVDAEAAQEMLRAACINGDVGLAASAIEKGTNCRVEFDDDGDSPLSVAIACDHVDIVKLLLDSGVGPDDEEQAWYGAITHGKKQIADLLKAAGFEADAGKAFAIACRGGGLDFAHSMLPEIEEINKSIWNTSGSTAPPFLLAAETGDASLVRAVLDRGCDIDGTDENDTTAWIAAAARGHRSVYEMEVLSHQQNVDFALIEAIRISRYDIAEQWLDRGANPKTVWENRHDRSTLSALHAVLHANYNLEVDEQLMQTPQKIKWLIERGADPLILINHPERRCPAGGEVERGYEAFLCEALVDIESIDEEGDSLLTRAFADQNIDRIAMLLHLGADLTHNTADGLPCPFALFRNESQWSTEPEPTWVEEEFPTGIFNLIVAHGFDVNEKDGNGNSFVDRASVYHRELADPSHYGEAQDVLLNAPTNDDEFTDQLNFLIGKVSIATQALIASRWMKDCPELFNECRSLISSNGTNLKRIGIACMSVSPKLQMQRARFIAEALDDENASVRHAAMQALLSLGETGTRWLLDSLWNCSAEQVHERVICLLNRGRESFDAVGQWIETEIDETYAHERYLKGMILGERGRWYANRSCGAEALDDLRKSVYLYPNNQLGHWEPLAELLRRQGHDSLANALVLYNQGQQSCDVDQEREHYHAAHELYPEFPWSRNNLAWSLATCDDASMRDGAEALRLAMELHETEGWDFHGIWDTLSAACIETGDIDNAIRYAEKAVCSAEPHAIQEYEDNLIRLRREVGVNEAAKNVLTIERAREFVDEEKCVDESEGFTEIEDAAAHCLGRLNSYSITLSVQQLSVIAALGLGRFSGSLYFRESVRLSDDAIAKLSQASASLVFFGSWGELTSEQAKKLSRHRGGDLALHHVATTKPDALDLIAQHPQVFVDTAKPTPKLMEAMVEGADDMLEFDRVEDLTVELAKVLAKSEHGFSFTSLSSITDECLEILCNIDGYARFGGLTELTISQQEMVGASRGSYLSFPDLKTISLEMTERMSGFQGDLCLYPEKLDSAIAMAFSRIKHINLEFDNLRELTSDAARLLPSLHCDSFWCDGLADITPETAFVLSELGLSVGLDGLETLSDEVAAAFRSFSGKYLSLFGLRTLSIAAAHHLAAIAGELRVDPEKLAPEIATILCPDWPPSQNTSQDN